MISLDAFGPLLWPLASCSLLALALVLERLWVFIGLQPVSARSVATALSQCRECEQTSCQQRSEVTHTGVALLLSHRSLPVTQREEVMGCWLQAEQHRLTRHLRLLQLIGVLAPMLGLLGTVLGLVNMFADIASLDQPVTPALLANGLWQALYTTVWGLAISIPSLAAGQGFALWAEYYLNAVERVLNRCQLALAGLDTEAVTKPSIRWVTS